MTDFVPPSHVYVVPHQSAIMVCVKGGSQYPDILSLKQFRRLQLRHQYKFPNNERSGPDDHPSDDGDISVDDEPEVDVSKLTREKKFV
ncbi:hypothetical protein Tco_1428371 [Tanacetum coccineum]